MKKKNAVNLIKYHVDGNNEEFKREAIEIARMFNANGDEAIGDYIMSIFYDNLAFAPQQKDEDVEFIFLKVPTLKYTTLNLPQVILNDVHGIINAINSNTGVNKFIFAGQPGTGKTECAQQIARLSNRQIYFVETSNLVDSKLGQTPKNIVALFKEINSIPNKHKAIILFDEIDSIVLDRINSNDIREMGRATSTFLKQLDELNNNVVVIATSNLLPNIDKALIRRFDAVINFDRYKIDDILEVADSILEEYLKHFKHASKNKKLFHKIIRNMKPMIYPGDLKNMIRVSLAFSNTEFGYLTHLLKATQNLEDNFKISDIAHFKFTTRELEILTGISKSTISRGTYE